MCSLLSSFPSAGSNHYCDNGDPFRPFCRSNSFIFQSLCASLSQMDDLMGTKGDENYPIPPSRRAVRKVPKVGIRAAIKSKIAASVMAVKSVLLRPTRSAMHPHNSAPVARPVYVTTPDAKHNIF